MDDYVSNIVVGYDIDLFQELYHNNSISHEDLYTIVKSFFEHKKNSKGCNNDIDKNMLIDILTYINKDDFDNIGPSLIYDLLIKDKDIDIFIALKNIGYITIGDITGLIKLIYRGYLNFRSFTDMYSGSYYFAIDIIKLLNTDESRKLASNMIKLRKSNKIDKEVFMEVMKDLKDIKGIVLSKKAIDELLLNQ